MLAKRQAVEGDLEVDDSAIVSEGDDNGAYVTGWKWISFEGMALDKELTDEDDDVPSGPAPV